MLDIVILIGSLVGTVLSVRHVRGRAQPLAWTFWFFLALLISSVAAVFFDDLETVKEVAAAISIALMLFSLSLMARSTSLDRGS